MTGHDFAAAAAAAPATIPQLLTRAVAEHPDEPALGVVVGESLSWFTWRQVEQEVRGRAAVLLDAGLRPGDRAVQWGENSADWIFADLAIQLAGGVHVPLHGALAPAQAAAQAMFAAARWVLGTAESLAALNASRGSRCDAGATTAAWTALDYQAWRRRAAEVAADATEFPRVDPDDLATILFTSGTGGAPLGVELTQANLVANVGGVCDMIDAHRRETRLGVLPLSHVYARTCDLYVWLHRGSKLALARRRETLLADLQLVRPTAINLVPYLYQKIAHGLTAAGSAHGDALRGLFGGEIRRLYCGGAAMPGEIEAWYRDLGLPVYCGYGLSEASPVVTMTNPHNHVVETVGRPLANLELRLGDDGEVLVRGPSVMRGYWRNPAATAAALEGGWLHTGDLGELSPEGNLRIVGRKKEMIALSTGKKVAPGRLELLLTASPLIEQACVVGDGQPRLAALIVPCREAAAQRLGIGADDAALRRLIAAEITQRLGNEASWEQLAQFALLPRSLTVEQGELTPKFSLRRATIAANFAGEIAALERGGCG